MERSVLVKRKADDEPLEILYVEDSASSSISPRKKRHVFRRVITTETFLRPTPGGIKNGTDESGIPHVGQHDVTVHKPDLTPQKPPAPDLNDGFQNGQYQLPQSQQQRRRFRMLKERVTSSVLETGSMRGQKRKTAAAQLVVFEEDRSKKVRSGEIPRIQAPDSDATAKTNPTHSTVKPARKRPNASPAERLWRQASWSNLASRSRSRDVSPMPPSTRTQNRTQPQQQSLAMLEIASLELALELHAFSMEETERGERLNGGEDAEKRFKDNTAPTTADEGSSAARVTDGEHGYVYDRYMRCPTPPTATDASVALPAELKDAAQGYLVIDAEDEAAWTAYLDDMMDDDKAEDEDLLDDDEDSNGKMLALPISHPVPL